MTRSTLFLVPVLLLACASSPRQQTAPASGKAQRDLSSVGAYPEAVTPCLAAMKEVDVPVEVNLMTATEQGDSCAISIWFEKEADLETFVQHRVEAGLSARAVSFKGDSTETTWIPLELQVGGTVEH